MKRTRKKIALLLLSSILALSSTAVYASETDDTSPVPVAAAEIISKGSINLTDEDVSNGTYILTISGISAVHGISKVYVPTWSENNGQDDIVWYEAAPSGDQWNITVNIANHKNDTGKYSSHVYVYDTENNSRLAANTSFEVKQIETPETNPPESEAPETPGSGSGTTEDTTKNSAVISAKDDSLGAYTISVTTNKNVATVMVPTWTEKNGQDDIIWYEAQQTASGWTLTVDSTNHNGESGKYFSHVYIFDAQGNASLLKGFTTTVKMDTKQSISISANSDQTQFTATLKNFRKQTSTIAFAVWGDANGQNDIVWYSGKQTNNDWSATIPISAHGETGRYNVHIYAADTNGAYMVGHTSFTVNVLSPGSSVTIADANNDAGTFKVVASNINAPAGIRQVQVAVWTSTNNKDDLVWYDAVQHGTNWELLVDVANHNYESGTYNVQVYVIDANGAKEMAKETSVGMTYTKKPASITATVHSDQTTVTLTVNNVLGAKTVSIPVWGSSNGQNDIIWYQATKQSSTSWETTVDLSKHLELGTYNAHVYADYGSGALSMVTHTTFKINKIKSNYYTITSKDDHYGTCIVNLNNAMTSVPIQSVSMAVWTEENGQDDLRWYSAAKNNGSWSAYIESINHNGESGKYIIHAYANLNEGNPVLIKGTSTELTRAARIYQNPSGYYQIQDTITLTGGDYNLTYGCEGLKVAKIIQYFGIRGGNYVGMGGAYYDQACVTAVTNFQRQHGLPATGVVDERTWLAMGFSAYDWKYLGAYVTPILVDRNSTREDHINAMIDTAVSYLGTDYVIGASGAPGTGIDCSGLVMQALFAAGIDTSPINPVRHSQPGYEYESQNMWASSKFLHVPYEKRQPGDLIFYQNANGVVIHVAIYIGNDQVVESWPNQVVIWPIKNWQRSNIKGVVRPFI